MGKPLKDWTLEDTKNICNARASRYQADPCQNCPLVNVICKGRVDESANIPGYWNLDEPRQLTVPELVICRATGAAWVTMDKGGGSYVSLWLARPTMTEVGLWTSDIQSLGLVHRAKFPSVRPGDCVEVPDG